MHDPQEYKQYLGKDKYYHDFLVFFQSEIEKKGWEAVLNEYVFARDDRADDMLVRMFAGFLHPIIHLGFGVEFEQPAIVAEALAQAAVHDDWIAPLFLKAEKEAQEETKGGPQKTIIQLLEEIRTDEVLSKAAHFEDGNKIRDGLMKRAPEQMLKYVSQYHVSEDELERKTVEMINAAGKQPSLFPLRFPFLLIKTSILHSRSATPAPPGEIRLLLHALHKQQHLLLRFLETSLALG
jgi:hypothetical protein